MKNKELEKGLLISLIDNPELIEQVAENLSVETFTQSAYQKVYKHIHKQYFKGGEVSKTKTLMYIKGELGGDKAAELLDSDYYNPLEIKEMVEELNKLKDQRIMRNTLTDCYEIIKTENNFMNAIQDKIFEVTSEKNNRELIKDAETVATESWEKLHERMEGITDNRIRTGYRSLDGALKLKRTHLSIVAGGTSMGKTTFALNIARKSLEVSNEPVLIISLEQEAREVMDRILIQRSKVCADDYEEGVNEQQEKALSGAFNWVYGKPLKVVDERGLGVADIKALARRAYKQFGNKMGLILIDYLQEIKLEDESNLTRELGRAAQELRSLAKELDCHVMLLSQLSREFEKRDRKRPIKSDLRYSGELEQVADNIIFVHRPAYFEERTAAEEELIIQDDAEIIIAKQRGGKTPVLGFVWYAEIYYFQDAIDHLQQGELGYLKQG